MSPRQFSVGLAVLIAAGCASQQTKPPAPAAAQNAAAEQTPTTAQVASSETAPAVTAPLDQRVVDLRVGDRLLRLAGVVNRVLGMRMVPQSVIFEFRDNTGTVRVVINEKADLNVGDRIELVGSYRHIPSPMYTGPGEAPKDNVFVVERFLVFP